MGPPGHAEGSVRQRPCPLGVAVERHDPRCCAASQATGLHSLRSGAGLPPRNPESRIVPDLIYFYAAPPEFAVIADSTLTNTLQTRVQVRQYIALVADRVGGAAIGVVSGTGLIAP